MTYLSNIIEEFNELKAYFDTIMPPREAKLIDKAKQAIQEANDNGKQGLNYPINYEPRGNEINS
jgi:hypothetical protein